MQKPSFHGGKTTKDSESIKKITRNSFSIVIKKQQFLPSDQEAVQYIVIFVKEVVHLDHVSNNSMVNFTSLCTNRRVQ